MQEPCLAELNTQYMISQEKIQQIRELRLQGMSIEQIRKQTGASQHTIETHTQDLRGVRRCPKIGDKEREAMRDMRKQGITLEEIGKRFGRHYMTVYVHCRDIHTPIKKPLKYTPEVIARIRELRAKGMTCVDVAAKLGVCPGMVSVYSRGSGRKVITPDEVQRMRRLRETGVSVDAIAQQLGRSWRTVEHYLEHDAQNVMPTSVDLACRFCNATIVVNVPKMVPSEVDLWLKHGRAVCGRCSQSFTLLDLTNRPSGLKQSAEARRIWYTLLGITFAE